MKTMASWLPEPGYTLGTGVLGGLAVLAWLGTSWQAGLAWTVSAVTVAGFGIWRKRKARP
jgi:hypothetical protein